MRSELTPTQMAEYLAKRKELWEERKEMEIQVAQVEPPEIAYKKPPSQVKEFASQTSETTGVTKSTINRAIARAEGVCEEARSLIKGTRLDKGTYLDALKKLPSGQQVSKVKADLAVKPVNVAKIESDLNDRTQTVAIAGDSNA